MAPQVCEIVNGIPSPSTEWAAGTRHKGLSYYRKYYFHVGKGPNETCLSNCDNIRGQLALGDSFDADFEDILPSGGADEPDQDSHI